MPKAPVIPMTVCMNRDHRSAIAQLLALVFEWQLTGEIRLLRAFVHFVQRLWGVKINVEGVMEQKETYCM